LPKEIVLYLCRDERSKMMLQDFQSVLNLLPKPERPKLKVKLVKINDPRDFPSFFQQLEELYGGVYTLEFKKLNIEKLPAIVVDGEKVSEGKYLSMEEIRDLLGIPVKIESIIDEKLMRASERGDAESVEMLLKKGANPNYRDNDGFSPLHFAAFYGRAKVAEILIRQGAEVNARDNDGNTPLHFAALAGDAKVAELLIRHGAEVNAKNNYGSTPLHTAAKWGNVEVVKLLLKSGADPTVRNNDGKSPLDVARESGQSEVARVIEKFTASRLAILGVETPELYAGEWDARAICPACGNKLVFIKTLNRYYCFKCKDYR